MKKTPKTPQHFTPPVRIKPEIPVLADFDRILRADRVDFVRSHATYVLNHHLDQITELELEVASGADPKTAFGLRHFLEGRRHAILLARSYPAALFAGASDGSGLAGEVKRSVLEHPRIWHRIHHHSFAILFKGLASTMGIVFSGSELLELESRLGKRLTKELQSYIASHI